MTWLRLERLENNDLDLPKYAVEGSAGIDFAACLTRPCLHATKEPFNVSHTLRGRFLTIEPGQCILVPLGFKTEFESRLVLKLYIRSSLCLRGLMLANSVAIIDSSYRGELYVPLLNRLARDQITIEHGDRIVQGILESMPGVVISETTTGLTSSARGTGGFGSTGVN